MVSSESSITVVPEYFPTRELLSRLLTAPCWSLGVDVPYKRQTHQNRTKIRLPDHSLWLSVPVKKRESGTRLSDIEIDYSYPWIQDHIKGLKYNYSTAPYYEHYAPGIQDLLNGRPRLLHELTSETLLWMAKTIGIATKMESHDTPGFKTIYKEDDDCQPANHIELPSYRQNFPGFVSDVGSLDLLLNHGPSSIKYLKPLP